MSIKKLGPVEFTGEEARRIYDIMPAYFEQQPDPGKTKNFPYAWVVHIATSLAGHKGDLETLKMICTKLDTEQQADIASYILGNASHYGRTEIVEWVGKEFKQYLEPSFIAFSFTNAAVHQGTPATLRAIFSLDPEGITKSKDFNYIKDHIRGQCREPEIEQTILELAGQN